MQSWIVQRVVVGSIARLDVRAIRIGFRLSKTRTSKNKETKVGGNTETEHNEPARSRAGIRNGAGCTRPTRRRQRETEVAPQVEAVAENGHTSETAKAVHYEPQTFSWGARHLTRTR